MGEEWRESQRRRRRRECLGKIGEVYSETEEEEREKDQKGNESIIMCRPEAWSGYI